MNSKFKKNEEKLFISNKEIKILKNNRNYGLDLARIISMIFIINHHIIFHGGLLSKTKKYSIEFNFFIFFNIMCCTGVNIFGMISGFVGYNKHKYSNLLFLLFTTFYYNFGVAFFFNNFWPKIVIKDIQEYLIPIFITNYWYFNSYFLMYFFLPAINKGIMGMNHIEMKYFLINLFIIFSCLGQLKNYIKIFNKKDYLLLKNGFSHSWLIILYLYGSYFGRFKNIKNKKQYFYIKYFSLILLSLFTRTKIILNTYHKYNYSRGMNIDYTSPSAVLISISFIIIFATLNINNKFIIKFISFFSPLTFGIYLLHNHNLFRKFIITKKFLWLFNFHSNKLILIEIICSIILFLICAILDYIRHLIFKLFRIRQFCMLIVKSFQIMANKLIF